MSSRTAWATEERERAFKRVYFLWQGWVVGGWVGEGSLLHRFEELSQYGISLVTAHEAHSLYLPITG